MIRAAFFESHVADVDETIDRVDAASDTDSFGRVLTQLIENASSRLTVPRAGRRRGARRSHRGGPYRLTIAREESSGSLPRGA